MSDSVPAGATTPPGDIGLEAFVGKPIEKICGFGFGKTGDDQNHCAHFVGHALRHTGGQGLTCEQMLAKAMTKKHPLHGQRGALLRVNDLYAGVTGKAKLDHTAAELPNLTKGLIFVSVNSNYINGIEGMGSQSRKHVGIIKDGHVIHYGNTADAVRKDTLKTFIKHMTGAYGAAITFVTTDLPGAVAPAGS